ncbi:MAG: glycosyltransferase family 2 protein [Pirellulaceae bacterium]
MPAVMQNRDVTALILASNEQVNIGRGLERLGWLGRVVVVDSGSMDDTARICETFPNVEVVVRPFDSHTAQWNFGLDQVATEWVLSLDADYMLPQSFPAEVSGLTPPPELDAYYARFRYCVFGKPLRGSLYPPRAVLFRKSRCRYEQDGHTQLLRVPGATGQLVSVIDHDDRKPLSHWLSAQRKYAALEAHKLRTTRPLHEKWPDRVRRMIWPTVPATLLYTLFAKRLILDGWAGWLYALQRTYAELLLALELLDAQLRPSEADAADSESEGVSTVRRESP